ncbi:MAG: hypothetical protein QOF46_2614, partial [Paraburkholderia sp.]|nr:hypothetical protein [Paraburkholderia sp.]
MDQSGTSEVEQPVSGEHDAQADAVVQFDLFGMPVETPAVSSKADAGAKAQRGIAGAEAATGVAAGSSAATQALAAVVQAERGREPRTKASGATMLWQEDNAPVRSQTDTETAANAATATNNTPKKRRTRDVLAAPPSPELLALAADLPPQVHLGTSTWSFPGWNGIVYGDDYSNSKLSREGLTAYGAHPLLRTVSIDRSFYQALTVTEYLRYAQQVPAHFRFIVKAPMTITDATVRAERGEPVSLNPCFLNAQMAIDEFVTPCLEGLGAKAGALVFQLSPLPDQMLAQPAVFIERLAEFLLALPRLPDGTCYAIEIRDASLLTPRFIRTLKTAG